MQTFTLKFEKLNPETGTTYKREEEFTQGDGSRGPVFFSVYRRADGSIDTGMGYSGATREAFEAEWQAKTERQFAEAVKAAAAGKAAAARKAEFVAGWQRAALAQAVVGLQEADAMLKALDYAAEEGSLNSDVIDALALGKAKETRKALLAAWRDAKAEARDQYEDSYNDAEDKDDFYDDFADDIADSFVRNL
jgi:hypothetical protein